ncbi:MAG TPA: Asp-tRNA(Asn)/Glu-tRNA(Gln) amidotransferase subunit GatB [Candidatus Paceibacterota bacterium]
MEYKPTIGLEVHAELKTETKMFCDCKNDPDEKSPNKNICPVCMGHPGTLPVINREAVKHILKIGLALGGHISDESEFDRKNYFYPDIPKGYQISQYKYPFVVGGELAGIKLTRIHLEEDTARSSHSKGDYSLVDFNRAGVPLMELVTEPVIHSASKVVEFGEELQKLLQYLEISDANMEKGEMRLEANISVSNTDVLGTKVEVKNLNSFKSAGKAIEYEIKRQVEILKSGGTVSQETRGFDEHNQKTFSQRLKESSHDYRYFPDPDLPKLKISEIEDFAKDTLVSATKETPTEKRARFKKDYGIKTSDIDFYVSNPEFGNVFELAAKEIPKKEGLQVLSNYVVSDLASFGERGLLIGGSRLSGLIKMILEGSVSSRGAKIILQKMTEISDDPSEIAKKEGLFQKSDTDELLLVAKSILDQNKDVALSYKEGKTSAIQFLVGQGMKATKGSANPNLIRSIFEDLLKA